jgi:hypothetical protein
VTRDALCAAHGTAFRPARAKAASRGIPLAAALQIRSPDSRAAFRAMRGGWFRMELEGGRPREPNKVRVDVSDARKTPSLFFSTSSLLTFSLLTVFSSPNLGFYA